MVLGISKHRNSGHPVNNNHFTGKKKKSRTPRKHRLTRKQKLMKRRTHKNKYAGAA